MNKFNLSLLVISLLLLIAISATVELIDPGDNTWSDLPYNNPGMLFRYNHSGLGPDGVNCTLFINGAPVNITINTSENINYVVYSNTSFSEGTNVWNIACYNSTFGPDGAASRTLKIDYTNPSVMIHAVNGFTTNNSWTNNRTITIRITANDTNLLWFYPKLINSLGEDIDNWGNPGASEFNTSYNETVSSDGTYLINLSAEDRVPNWNTTYFTIHVDSTAPTAVINSINELPMGGGTPWTTNTTLRINFTANDTSIKNWTLSVYDSSMNLLTGWNGINNNISSKISYNAPTDDIYYVNLSVVDNATNPNSTLSRIGVDTINPSINNISISSVTSNGATITVNASDATAYISNCAYNLSSNVGSGDLTFISSDIYSKAITGLSSSTFYNVTLICTDNAGNTNSSLSNFTTSAGSSSSSSSSSGGGGGGGGGGGSGGGGSSGTTTYVLTEVQLKEGYTNIFGKGDKIKFTFAGEEHYITMDEVSSDYVKINVTSTLQQAIVYLGKEAKFNLNENDYYDLSVKLSSINATANKATLMVEEIAETESAAKSSVNPLKKETVSDSSVSSNVSVPLKGSINETGTWLNRAAQKVFGKKIPSWGWLVAVTILVILILTLLVRKIIKRKQE